MPSTSGSTSPSPNRYRAFGLLLESSRSLPEPAPPEALGKPDVSLRFGRPPDTGGRLLPWARAESFVAHRQDSGRYRIRYRDGAEFWVEADGSTIWVGRPAEMALEYALTYLFGPILGLVLRLRGTICLHAAAFALDGRAVVLLGAGGAGKSTACAWLADNGLPILADDVVALERTEAGFTIQPGLPWIRLWPRTEDRRAEAPEVLEPLAPGWEKRYRDLRHSDRFATNALPLAAIYGGTPEPGDGAARLAPLGVRDSFAALASHPYPNRDYRLPRRLRVAEFELLQELAERVPVRAVRFAAGLERLPETCAALLEDARRLPTARRAACPA